MEKLLSIIIPTYNMEKYLQRALDSLLITRGLNLIDVVIVNDGSKDSSSLIAHGYVEKYPAIFQVIDKENGNYGSCINAALKIVRGKYVKILDADDYFQTDVLQSFIEKLETIDTDAILTDFSKVSDEGLSLQSFPMYKNGQVVNMDVEILSVFAMHSVTFRTKVFREMNYKQTEGISYTDMEWVFYPMGKVRSVIYLNLNLYQYVLGREGQTMEFATFCKRIGQLETIVKRMLQHLLEISTISLSRKEYLLTVVFNQTRNVYQVELLQNEYYSYENLYEIDQLWKQLDAEWYRRLGKLKKDRYVPVYYVDSWRRKGKRMSKLGRRFVLIASTLSLKFQQKASAILKIIRRR